MPTYLITATIAGAAAFANIVPVLKTTTAKGVPMLSPNQERIDKGMWWDRAWSLVEGCTPVSPACKNCWSASATAMRACQKNLNIKARYGWLVEPGSNPPKFNGIVRPMWDDLNKPTPRQKPAVWAVWNDLFHKDVPFEFQYKAFERMLLCPQHFFIVCTKRPERMADVVPEVWFHLERNYSGFFGAGLTEIPLKNVMAMTTAENQEQADKRIPHLLRVDFAWRGLSVEPMLEKILLDNGETSWLTCNETLYGEPDEPECCMSYYTTGYHFKGIDFVACGPETGPGARPCNSDWIFDLYEQCRAAGVPFFDKRKDYLAREFPK